MKCEEIQEYLSALCDGERIPSQAAEHIGFCELCRDRMSEYLKMGAELRRMASMEVVSEVQPGAWKEVRRRTSTWWAKGWETMRIPRFAFAALLAAVVALASGLLITNVRAQSQGTVLMLTIKIPSGEVNRCALSLVDERSNICAWLDPTRYLMGLKILSHSGDQINLGVRAKYTPIEPRAGNFTASLEDLQKVEEKQYWFKPGDSLEIDVPGWGTMILTGELLDHMPPFVAVSGAQMDPKSGELQVISPLLLRDNKVLFDFEGSMSKGMRGVQMYMPGKGLWVLSLTPLDGAVEAKVNLNRISFELDGHSYTFWMGAPVARSEERVWIFHDAKYRSLSAPHGFIGSIDPVRWKKE